MSQTERPDIKQRFGKAVRRRRRELDISQEELAERAGFHRTYISNIERGELNPSLENVERISTALQLAISKLFLEYGVDAEAENSD